MHLNPTHMPPCSSHGKEEQPELLLLPGGGESSGDVGMLLGMDEELVGVLLSQG
ncbi:hypothetical protein HaLaN_05503, partial [Haematococcus lacustris]